VIDNITPQSFATTVLFTDYSHTILREYVAQRFPLLFLFFFKNIWSCDGIDAFFLLYMYHLDAHADIF
jgi:hypothetical protein